MGRGEQDCSKRQDQFKDSEFSSVSANGNNIFRSFGVCTYLISLDKTAVHKLLNCKWSEWPEHEHDQCN